VPAPVALLLLTPECLSYGLLLLLSRDQRSECLSLIAPAAPLYTSKIAKSGKYITKIAMSKETIDSTALT